MGKSAAVKKNQWAYQPSPKKELYTSFELLDGSHPWKDWVPEGFIPYKARKLNRGQVAYFNFELAKEMGLIAEDHPHEMNVALGKKLIETFAIRIINEYDIAHKTSFPEATLKDGEFMATRYLQLQHPNKTGTTSGDGRCIWNGVISHRGRLWDVSSRGTGVTALAPGVVAAKKPLRSGNNQFGYGCGLAEMDELYGAAIMAEIFHRRGIKTERVLALIDFGDGYGIGVRAAPNLIRPAHIFSYLKQGNYDALKRSVDYLILRQQKNQEWKFGVHQPERYDLFLNEISESFSRFSAQLDREYIFAWLDWDGDNVLANAGIIDYGSIRQFGLRHDQYRYDDVERWSTNLNEQKNKARITFQVFIQMVDFLKTKEKKPLKVFKGHAALKLFDERYATALLECFLYQLGFSSGQRQRLLTQHPLAVKKLYGDFSYLERVKTAKRTIEVADGINRPAIFNLRTIAREFPRFLAQGEVPWELQEMDKREFFHLILAHKTIGKDARLNARVGRRIENFQAHYKNLLRLLDVDPVDCSVLRDMARRSADINRRDRLTGNALLFIVSEILKERRHGLAHEEVQKIIDKVIEKQTGSLKDDGPYLNPLSLRRTQQLLDKVLKLVDEHKEDI